MELLVCGNKKLLLATEIISEILSQNGRTVDFKLCSGSQEFSDCPRGVGGWDVSIANDALRDVGAALIFADDERDWKPFSEPFGPYPNWPAYIYAAENVNVPYKLISFGSSSAWVFEWHHAQHRDPPSRELLEFAFSDRLNDSHKITPSQLTFQFLLKEVCQMLGIEMLEFCDPPSLSGCGLPIGKKAFFSYRRRESLDFVVRVAADIDARYGVGMSIIDVTSIASGDDFRLAIDDLIKDAGVVLPIISENWLGNDIHCHDDHVRYELERAITYNSQLLPILQNGATMPQASKLPNLMRPMATINAVNVWSDPKYYELCLEHFFTALDRAIWRSLAQQ